MPLRPKTFEPSEVDPVRTDFEHVTRRASSQDIVRLEQLPEPGDVLLEGGRSILGRGVTPELLDQAVGRDHAACLEQQQGEETALLDAPEAKLPLPLPDLEWAEDVKVEAASQGATVARSSVRRLTAR